MTLRQLKRKLAAVGLVMDILDRGVGFRPTSNANRFEVWLRGPGCYSKISFAETKNSAIRQANSELEEAIRYEEFIANYQRDPQFSIENLNRTFVGKNVVITHSGIHCADDSGICVAFHDIPRDPKHVDIELQDGSRYGFKPQIMDDNSVEGEIGWLASGHRKVAIAG